MQTTFISIKPIPHSFIHPRSARQRALLKLSAFAICAILFVMLACSPSPPPPPPFAIDLTEGPRQIFPGNSAQYLFTIRQQGSRELKAETLFEIGVRRSESDDEILHTFTVGERREFPLHVTMPADLQPGEYLVFSFRLKEEAWQWDTSTSIRQAPEVSIYSLNHPFMRTHGPSADMLVQVYDNRHQRPLTNAAWATRFGHGSGYVDIQANGLTNEQGIAQIGIEHRDAPIWNLDYSFDFSVETDRGEFNATFGGQKAVEAFDVLVSTDKPVYQPGQTIHMRTLALLKTSLKAAADQEIRVQLVDPKGTIISNKTIETSDYGVASLDFPLDSQIASGDYTLQAETSFGVYTRVVEVKPYTLPRF